jgi:hypothetical protein
MGISRANGAKAINQSHRVANVDVSISSLTDEDDRRAFMNLPQQSASRSLALTPLPEHSDALLRLLVTDEPDWDEIAALVLRDAALLLSLLEASPLSRQRLGSMLKTEVSRRLQRLGADLARTWLMQAVRPSAPAGARTRAMARQSIIVAECALHLARQTRNPHPDEAYIAGLWQMPADCGAEDTSAELHATLAERCGLPAPVVDALAFTHALEEQLLAAHPLVRLLWSARQLARPDWQEDLDRIGRVCGLSRESLASLRTDVAFIVGIDPMTAESPANLTAETGAEPSLPALAQPPCAPSDTILHDALFPMLVRDAFAGQDPEQVADRLELACRLLCGEASPLIVVPDAQGMLHALPSGSTPGLDEWFDELALRQDDDASVIALAMRSATATSWHAQSGAPVRSPRDWHVSRRLGRGGIVCLPLRDRRAVAVLGVDERQLVAPETRAVLTGLGAAAARAVLDARRKQTEQAEAEARIEARFREHARRIAHEASNPLTVIKNYLGIMARRHPDTPGPTLEMAAVHQELDRIADLLQRAGDAPALAAEPAFCRVAELLHDLRALYGESLFEDRGIRFELRTVTGMPPAAIPASALKQVLLNLFRNAAEALQPGGRFSVTVPGQVLSNGIPCLEIRLIDNGPGLPRERLIDLFGPRPSEKGDVHQGLGLSIVREILEQWRASILCRSQPGTGTSFQLLLPLDNST